MNTPTTPEPPYGCKLIAHDTGDGWSLEVHNQKGEFVADLAWPEQWEAKNGQQLREAGFEVV